MKGLLFIPDISGFTNFVKTNDPVLGAIVIKELLSNIIESNPLQLKISEIEGDAILFYKVGPALPISAIFDSSENIIRSFNTKFKKLRDRYQLNTPLSLKLVVHYGDIFTYDIAGYKKLYGQAVIESHRLLKNGTGIPNYILITNEYFQALEEQPDNYVLPRWLRHPRTCQVYDGLREICFHYFSFMPLNYRNEVMIKTQS